MILRSSSEARWVLDVSREFDDYWNDRWSVPIESLSHAKTSPADLDNALRAREGIAELHIEETAEARLERWKTLATSAHAAHSTLLADDPPDESPALAKEAPVQVANALMELFDTAENEIIIVSAYLVPTPELSGAVVRAVQRGVRVRMLTNSIRSNNHLTAHSAYRNHIREMLDSGAEMHEVRIDASDRGMYMLSPVSDKQLALHAKALIVDLDKVFVGSANLDPRSLRINTEMGFILESEALNEALRAAVAPDFEQSNAWQLELDDDGDVFWVSDEVTLNR